MREPEKLALDAFLALFGAFLIYALGHGWWMDVVLDRPHGDECYFCNFYRLNHADNVAFQVREARRAAK